MRPAQYLNPAVIYQFNALFQQVWDSLNLKSAYGYDLHLMSVDSTDGLLNEGRNLVIVALVDTDLHIRIFDANGKRAVDKAENELISGGMLAALKKQLNPLPNESGLSKEQKQKLIWDATSIAGHAQKDAYVLPVFFNKHRRTFHWISIGSEMWNWETFQGEKTTPENRVASLKTILEQLRPYIEQQTDAWRRFVDDLPKTETYQRAVRILEKAVMDAPGNRDDWSNLHPALLLLYSGFHQSVRKNLEGVVYGRLEKCGGRPVHYLTGVLWKNPNESEEFQEPEYKWLDLDDAENHSLKTWCGSMTRNAT